MEITVLPFRRLKARQREFDVIITILDPCTQNSILFKLPKIKGQQVIRCYCSDVSTSFDSIGLIPDAPRIEQFKNIANNAKRFVGTNKHIGIACMAGISRSPATALLVLAVKYQSARKAIEELDKLERSDEFIPNDLITHYADVILCMGGTLDNELSEYKKKRIVPFFSRIGPESIGNSALGYIHSIQGENIDKPWSWIRNEPIEPEYNEWYFDEESKLWKNRNDQT